LVRPGGRGEKHSRGPIEGDRFHSFASRVAQHPPAGRYRGVVGRRNQTSSSRTAWRGNRRTLPFCAAMISRRLAGEGTLCTRSPVPTWICPHVAPRSRTRTQRALAGRESVRGHHLRNSRPHGIGRFSRDFHPRDQHHPGTAVRDWRLPKSTESVLIPHNQAIEALAVNPAKVQTHWSLVRIL
jgi:hypothetical protein